ncbi:MAG: MBL fold metallo-hydrolase [Thermodesulfobacteriota bacterium]
MKVTFLGAAQTVTGSCYVLECCGRRFAVDCGMHQGHPDIEARNRDTKLYRPADIDFFLITHAHMDHSGLLPSMVKNGFKGTIHCTPPTRDLLEIMLLDSANIQEMEAEWKGAKRARRGLNGYEALYTTRDAERTMGFFKTVEYNEPFSPAEGVTVTYKDAGHILGSAFIEMVVEEDGRSYTMLFSGDLGRPDQLIVRDPSIVTRADYLFLESTYGDRNHKDESTSRRELAEAIAYAYKNREKVVIPAFAVERTQELLYCLHLLEKDGKLPGDMPVYVDSPLAIRATEIFRRNTRYFDADAQAMLSRGEDPLTLKNLRYSLRREDSQEINAVDGPAIVIAGSGMCNAGRIKHHLRHNIWRPGAAVVFVGFQAKGTPGRKIVDGATHVRLHGEDVLIKARVFTIGGFSGHAGQSQILDWLSHFANREMQVYLVHGENSAQETLAGLIREKYNLAVQIPSYLEECTLVPGEAPVVEVFEEKAFPRVDWDYLLAETDFKLAELKRRLAELKAKPWVDQVELRDRLAEVNTSLLKLVSQV